MSENKKRLECPYCKIDLLDPEEYTLYQDVVHVNLFNFNGENLSKLSCPDEEADKGAYCCFRCNNNVEDYLIANNIKIDS